PGLRAELDPLGLDQCFTFWSPLAPRTAFKGVQELPPGHQLIAQDGTVKVEPYWKLRFPPRGERSSADGDETGEQVEALLADATRIRMRADVPVGAYLSGGFDSSVTTALAKRHNGALRTFSLEFESPELDESAFQRTLVAALSTDPLFSHLPRFALTRRISQFYSGELRRAINGYEPLEDLRASLPPEFGSWHPLSRAQYLETACLLPGYILSSQGDRVAMAHAV